MIGCHALTDEPALTIDRTELEDARWFTRAEVEDAVAAAGRNEPGEAFRAPGRHAIANALLRWWVQR
jgi:NAD+ diphosphatase